MLEGEVTDQEKCAVHKNDYHADLSSNLTKYPGLKLVNIGRVNAKICPILFCIDIVFSVSIRSVPAGKVVSRSSMVPAIMYDNFMSNVKFVNSKVQCWTVGAIFTFGPKGQLISKCLFEKKSFGPKYHRKI